MNTCGNCPNLKANKIQSIGAIIFGCSKTGKTVPHNANFTEDSVTFWRIPTDCPRNDVVKSEEKAPESDWVIMKISSF